MNDTTRRLIFILAAACCFIPFVTAPIGLLLGLLFSQTLGNPFQHYTRKYTKILLQVCVVGLGFGMNLHEAMKAGREGFLFTIATITGTFIIGMLLSKFLKINNVIGYLISSGTAICGGSAIAAVSPLVDAKEEEITISLGTVFILNSVALLLFPFISHQVQISPEQFGLWCAVAIHDTSSVVGAADHMGDVALQVATTVKLERALWIIPLSIVTAIIFRNEKRKITVPWFIFYFIGAMAIHTFLPQYSTAGSYILVIAKKGLVLTLFLIGAGLTRETIKAVGPRPMLMGVILWVIVSVSTLIAILCRS